LRLTDAALSSHSLNDAGDELMSSCILRGRVGADRISLTGHSWHCAATDNAAFVRRNGVPVLGRHWCSQRLPRLLSVTAFCQLWQLPASSQRLPTAAMPCGEWETSAFRWQVVPGFAQRPNGAMAFGEWETARREALRTMIWQCK